MTEPFEPALGRNVSAVLGSLTDIERRGVPLDPNTCDGVRIDPFCPQHGSAPVTRHPHGPCLGDRWWECATCKTITPGSRCINCGRAADLRIFDPAMGDLFLPNPLKIREALRSAEGAS